MTPATLRDLSAYLDGGSSKGAADRLGCTPGTFRGRLARVHARLGVESTTAAVWSLRHELEAYRGEAPDPAERP